MWEAMRKAPVGDDVMEEDPTVKELEVMVSELTGKEDALFCVSGTMSNQIGIRTHLKSPPHSVLCDASSHVYNYEAGGISFHSQATVTPVRPQPGKTNLTLDAVKDNLILSDDVHYAPTKLVCLENTMNGEIMALPDIREISEYARSLGIGMHLDGARLWNASVATGISLKEYGKDFDSVRILLMSLCLSKGLGAPIGSILVGDKAFIRKARHYRKLFGGGLE
ncbi:Threonine aldolase [Phlyctochytrium planicorne]|nr:Threonine aldolase [Phlyctochytrium planicorne]